jgi:TRAP-type C4-dicarboxylate transport system permease large subunit
VQAGFNLTTILQRPETIIQLLSVGIPLAGVVGAAAAGSAAFTGALMHYLQDQQRPWRVWGVIAGTAALVMALGFIILAGIFAGDSQPLQAAAAGFLIGLVLAATAALPLRQATAVRLGFSILAGCAIFVAAWAAGLIFNNGPAWWLLLMGGMSGAGFFWGLDQEKFNNMG